MTVVAEHEALLVLALLVNIDILIGQKIGNVRHWRAVRVRLALYRLDRRLACAGKQNVGVRYSFGWHRLTACALGGSLVTLETLVASRPMAIFDEGAIAVSRAE